MKKVVIFIIITLIICLIPIPNKKDDEQEYKAIIYQITKSENKTTVKLFGFKIIEKIKEEKPKDLTIDEFYNQDIAKNYKDLRDLSKTYTEKEAISDNCFVISEDVHNDHLFSQFIDDYENKKPSFIRVVQFTLENNMLIYDLMYQNNKIYFVQDVTRDPYAYNNIQLYTYEKMATYTYQYHTYWVLYNGELTDQSLFGEDTFIISYI